MDHNERHRAIYHIHALSYGVVYGGYYNSNESGVLVHVFNYIRTLLDIVLVSSPGIFTCRLT